MRYDEPLIHGIDDDGNKVALKLSADGSLTLEGGDATAANQDEGNLLLASIDEKTPALGQALTSASSPVVLPAAQITALAPLSTVTANLGTIGAAATAAKQDTGNTSLTSIDTKTPALGQALAAASVPVVLTALQIAAIASETTLAKLIWTSTAITSASGSYSSQNGSEKTFTVPAGVEWQITDFYTDFVTSATVGTRQLAIRILDASDNAYCRLPAGTTQAASLTRRYSWGVGLPDMTSFRDTDKLQTPLPPLILPAGFKIKILDTAAVDTAADALTVRGLILQRSI